MITTSYDTVYVHLVPERHLYHHSQSVDDLRLHLSERAESLGTRDRVKHRARPALEWLSHRLMGWTSRSSHAVPTQLVLNSDQLKL